MTRDPIPALARVLLVAAAIALAAGSDAVAPQPAPAAAAEAVVYRWDPATLLAQPGPAATEAVPGGAGGGGRLRFTTADDGWNTLLLIPAGVLQGEHEYLAKVAYEIVAPPPFPGTFHLFARSKTLGQGRDVWIDWLGDPGDHGVARLPMRLPAANDWTFTIGCKGRAAIILDDVTISAGSGFTYLPATADAAPVPAPVDAGAVATGCIAVAIEPPAPGAGLEVSAADFGLVADGAAGPAAPDVAAANAVALQQALVDCRTRGASRLSIPAGTYRFNPRNPIDLEDLHDLTIDGHGAELVFTRLMRNVAALNLRRCQRMVLRDLRLDWDWTAIPIASLGLVKAVSADRLSCTMAFPDLDAAGVARLITAPWMGMAPTDPATFLHTSAQNPTAKVLKREAAEGNALEVGFSAAQPLAAGQHYLVRHLYYDMGAFKLTDCSHLLFDQVTIFSMPGMGWVGNGDLHHLALKRCRIVPRPGTRQPMTTAADGFHVMMSQGAILLEDCEFTRTGDDCVNIHDNCCQGVRRTAADTLVLVNNPRYRMRVAAGDRLELFHADYSPLGFVGTAKQVDYAGNDTVVVFAEPLPQEVSPLSIVFNRRYHSDDVRIAGCRFTHGRVMLSGRRLTVENCLFEHPFANALQLHTEIVGNLWAEGCGAEDVVIRGNTISDANLRGKFAGAAIHGAPVLPAGRTAHPLFRRILIEGNRFIDSHGPVISLGASAGVVVRGNRIEADAVVPGANALAGCVLVETSRDLSLSSNSWQAGAGQARPGVLFDAGTTSGLVASGNRIVAPR